MEFVGGLFIIAAYFIPMVVAFRRDHPYASSIMVVNLLLGWTFVGWVLALAWAVGPIEGRVLRA